MTSHARAVFALERAQSEATTAINTETTMSRRARARRLVCLARARASEDSFGVRWRTNGVWRARRARGKIDDNRDFYPTLSSRSTASGRRCRLDSAAVGTATRMATRSSASNASGAKRTTSSSAALWVRKTKTHVSYGDER